MDKSAFIQNPLPLRGDRKKRMEIIKAVDLAFEYIRRDEEGNVEGITRAVDGVNLDIKAGDFVAILGHNGSGKSTLAKLFNMILDPVEGKITVDGVTVTFDPKKATADYIMDTHTIEVDVNGNTTKGSDVYCININVKDIKDGTFTFTVEA